MGIGDYMWSDTLIAETVNSFKDLDNSKLKDFSLICMKSFDDKFGLVNGSDIRNNVFKVLDRSTNEFYNYETLDDLIKAGWVVD